MVNFGVPLKIQIDGLARQVRGGKIAPTLFIEAEAAQVRGEVERATRRELFERAFEKLGVVALDVEGADHGLRLREGRGIEED